MVQGRYKWTNGIRRYIGSGVIVSLGKEDGKDKHLLPISLALQGARELFVPVQKNNNNTLHTNPNFKVVQDSTNIIHDIIILKNTTKGTYYDNTPRKISQKTA